MIKRLLFFASSLLLLFISCTKQEDVTIDKLNGGGETESFTPMKVGNYWVYDVSWVDSMGMVEFIEMDSTYIAGDTMLNGNMYSIFKTSSSFIYTQYLRDSAQYLVDETGQKFFSPTNFSDKLYETAFVNGSGDTTSYTYRKMIIPLGPTHCLVGSFDALDAEMTRYLPFVNRTSKAHALYAPGVGLVFRQDFPLFSGKSKTYNLHHYHLE